MKNVNAKHEDFFKLYMYLDLNVDSSLKKTLGYINIHVDLDLN